MHSPCRAFLLVTIAFAVCASTSAHPPPRSFEEVAGQCDCIVIGTVEELTNVDHAYSVVVEVDQRIDGSRSLKSISYYAVEEHSSEFEFARVGDRVLLMLNKMEPAVERDHPGVQPGRYKPVRDWQFDRPYVCVIQGNNGERFRDGWVEVFKSGGAKATPQSETNLEYSIESLVRRIRIIRVSGLRRKFEENSKARRLIEAVRSSRDGFVGPLSELAGLIDRRKIPDSALRLEAARSCAESYLRLRESSRYKLKVAVLSIASVLDSLGETKLAVRVWEAAIGEKLCLPVSKSTPSVTKVERQVAGIKRWRTYRACVKLARALATLGHPKSGVVAMDRALRLAAMDPELDKEGLGHLKLWRARLVAQCGRGGDTLREYRELVNWFYENGHDWTRPRVGATSGLYEILVAKGLTAEASEVAKRAVNGLGRRIRSGWMEQQILFEAGGFAQGDDDVFAARNLMDWAVHAMRERQLEKSKGFAALLYGYAQFLRQSDRALMRGEGSWFGRSNPIEGMESVAWKIFKRDRLRR